MKKIISALLMALCFPNISAFADTAVRQGKHSAPSITVFTSPPLNSAGVSQNLLSSGTETIFETVSISSGPLSISANSSASALQPWHLRIAEGGGAPDGLSTIINQITMHLTGDIPYEKLNYELIIIDPFTRTLLTTIEGVRNNNSVTFTETIEVPNGGALDAKVGLYFSDTTGLTDGAQLTMSIDPQNDVQTASTGSQIGTTAIQSNSGYPVPIDIVYSELRFGTQPSTEVINSQLFTRQPVVIATDEFGNHDTSTTDTVSLSLDDNSVTIPGSLGGMTQIAMVAGVATFTDLHMDTSTDNTARFFNASASPDFGNSIRRGSSEQFTPRVVANTVFVNFNPLEIFEGTQQSVSGLYQEIYFTDETQLNHDIDFAGNVKISAINSDAPVHLSADNDIDDSDTSITVAAEDGRVYFTNSMIEYTGGPNGNGRFELLVEADGLQSASSGIVYSVNFAPYMTGWSASITVQEDTYQTLDLSNVQLADDTSATESYSLHFRTNGSTRTTTGTGSFGNVTVEQHDEHFISFDGPLVDIQTFIQQPGVIEYVNLEDNTNDNWFYAELVNVTENHSSIRYDIDVNVQAVNDAPVMSGVPPALVTQDQLYSFTPTLTDVDSPQSSLSVSAINLPAWLSLDTSTGQLTGSPDKNHVRIFSNITLTVSDGQLSSILTPFSINVINVNDAPEIQQGSPQTVNMSQSGSPTSLALTINAVDADSDALNWSIVESPSHGNAEMVINGTSVILSYTPDIDFTGLDNFTVIVSDGFLTDSIDIIVSVAPNSAPTATAQQVSVEEDNSLQVQLSGIDPEKSPLSFSVTQGPANGSYNLSGNVLTYTPTANFYGSDQLQFVTSDGQLTSTAATVSFTVTAINDAPTFSNTPSTSAVTGTLYSFTPQVSDVDGDSLSFSAQNLPGWLSINPNNGQLTGTPGSGDIGTVSDLNILVSDNTVSTALGAFNITVTQGNVAPQVEDIYVEINEDDRVGISLSGTDPDNDPLTFAISRAPGKGTATISNNILNYQSQPDVNGEDTLTYTASDGTLMSSAATLRIRINPVNDAPMISGEPITGVMLGEEYHFIPVVTDVDSDELTFTIDNKPQWANFSSTTGALTGTPTEEHIGATSGVVIRVSDGDISSALSAFDITVAAPMTDNQTPEITSAPPRKVSAGIDYHYDFAAIDPDGDALTFSLESAPSWLVLSQNDNVSATINGQAAEADAGLHNVTLAVSDGEASIKQFYRLVVTPQNNTAFPYTAESFESGPLSSYWYAADDSKPSWSVVNDESVDGQFSLRADTTGDSETADISYTNDFPEGTLHFSIKVSSASTDVFEFLLDGEPVEGLILSGDRDWQSTEPLTVDNQLFLSAGLHTLTFRYRKDGAGASLSDTAWVDNLTFAHSVIGNGNTPLDYDGDGKADLAVRDPNSKHWYIFNTSGADPLTGNIDGISRSIFGLQTDDITLQGDFDGDGKVDMAVRRPQTSVWYVHNSTGTDLVSQQSDGITRKTFGLELGDIPVPADYDGDGKTDIAVRRPSTHTWYILNSSGTDAVTDNADGITRLEFGRQANDIPVPADYDGDGKADIAVRRPDSQIWYIRNSSGTDTLSQNSDGITRLRFGRQTTDIPVPADYDGDGKADIAFRRPDTQTWYILNSSGTDALSQHSDGISRILFGRQTADIPVPADYDGDGKADIAVRRATTYTWYILNSSGTDPLTLNNDGVSRILFGRSANHIPVAAPVSYRMNTALLTANLPDNDIAGKAKQETMHQVTILNIENESAEPVSDANDTAL